MRRASYGIADIFRTYICGHGIPFSKESLLFSLR